MCSSTCRQMTRSAQPSARGSCRRSDLSRKPPSHSMSPKSEAMMWPPKFRATMACRGGDPEMVTVVKFDPRGGSSGFSRAYRARARCLANEPQVGQIQSRWISSAERKCFSKGPLQPHTEHSRSSRRLAELRSGSKAFSPAYRISSADRNGCRQRQAGESPLSNTFFAKRVSDILISQRGDSRRPVRARRRNRGMIIHVLSRRVQISRKPFHEHGPSNS